MNNAIKHINDQKLLNILEYGTNIKLAAFDSSFFNSIKQYFENQIDPNNKIGSLINLLAPGSLTMTIARLGFPKLGFFLGTIVSALGIDLHAIYSKIFETIIGLIKNQTATEDNVQSIITSTISSEDSSISDEELNSLEQLSTLSHNDVYYFHKLANLTNASLISKFAAKSNIKLKALQLIGKILFYFFTAALAAVGVNVAGNLVKKVFDKPNAFDQNITPTNITDQKPKHDITTIQSKQNTFPKNPNYSEAKFNGSGTNWIENYPNTTQGITNLLIDFAKEVYEGLDNLDSQIKNNPSFNLILNYFEDYNIDSVGDNSVFIPKKYKSKKEIVDQFIDDVAHTIKK